MRVNFYTLGCKVNQNETGALAQLFEANGYTVVEAGEEADVYVVNSCTVTNFGDQKSRKWLRRQKREHPQAVTVLTGCYPQAFPEEAATIREADVVTGSGNRRAILQDVEKVLHGEQERVVDIRPHHKGEAFEELPMDKFADHTRAFVKVEDGCNRQCAYCVIPRARGPVRSRSEASIMLTESAIRRLAAVPQLCPQFHLSLQSGCSKTLRTMRRPYTTEQYADIARRLREAFAPTPVSLTTDVIVGFPGETEEDFEESLRFVLSQRFLKVHVFPYSRRSGTPAFDFPDQIPEHEKEARSRRMNRAVEAVRAEEAAAMQGWRTPVLLETPLSQTLFTGYTPQYLPVYVSAPGHRSGDIVPVILGEWDGQHCHAALAPCENS